MVAMENNDQIVLQSSQTKQKDGKLRIIVWTREISAAKLKNANLVSKIGVFFYCFYSILIWYFVIQETNHLKQAWILNIYFYFKRFIFSVYFFVFSQ